MLRLVAMVTASPFEIAKIPELMKLVGSIVSAPPLEAAVIVPLLVKEFSTIWRVPPLAVWLMFPWLTTMPSPE